MDRKPLTNHAGITGVVRGAKRTGHLNSEIKSLEKRMRRNKMETEDKTCGDCEYAYFGYGGREHCEWHGEIDLDDLACSWFHALPDIEEE